MPVALDTQRTGLRAGLTGHLAPEILAAIEAAGEEELGVTEKELRRIARLEERVQLREWRKLQTTAATPRIDRE